MVSGVRLPNPDSVSQRLLARVGASAPPLGLHAIVNFWKDLDVLYEELDGAGYLFPLGHLGAEIIVNKNHPAERQRFTIAHEIGHWVLGLTWQKKIGEFRQPLGLAHETIAKWCDSFATNLLMPGLWIKAYFAGATGPSLIEFVTNAPADFSCRKRRCSYVSGSF